MSDNDYFLVYLFLFSGVWLSILIATKKTGLEDNLKGMKTRQEEIDKKKLERLETFRKNMKK